MSEELIKLFVIYLDRIGMLYDIFPNLSCGFAGSSEGDDINAIQGLVARDNLIIRNGGWFRIVINILIMLIDGRY